MLAKTHKTAGSTLGSILLRFGIDNNLTFALPKLLNKFGVEPFRPDMLVTQPPIGGFHIFVHHVPFNKTSIQSVVKSDAKFVTILRDPVTRFYSAANFFNMATHFGLSRSKEDIYSPKFPLSVLMDKIARCDHPFCEYTYNGQSYDLGQFHNETNLSVTEITERIELIDKQFDLVLLQDFLDESLLLLRRLMCWSFDDIVYISMKIRNRGKPYPSVHSHIEMIKKWNYVDVMLYEHFKRVLKERTNEYGPSFGDDLESFRNIKEEVVRRCENQKDQPRCIHLSKDVSGLTHLLLWRENKTMLRHLEAGAAERRKYWGGGGGGGGG